jgi:elongation factor G
MNRRRGRIVDVDSRAGLSQIKSEVPMAEMFGYATAMRSLSKGRASFSMEPLRFEEVPTAVAEKLTEHYA